MRRTSRDWAADTGVVLVAAAFCLLVAPDSVRAAGLSGTVLLVDSAVAGAACAALYLRRRWPVLLALATLAAGLFTHLSTGATLAALFSVAALRRPRTTAWVTGIALAPLVLVLVLTPKADGVDTEDTAGLLAYFALIVGSVGWGLFHRSRRQVLASLRERAERAAVEARRRAREDVAREMHDVLAHRLSLLSVHAGALEFNPGASPEEVRRAAGVIRDSAHQALQDLREVIGVLRAPEEDGAVRPQPSLGDLTRLAGESRAAGMDITLRLSAEQRQGVPGAVGRAVYRIVQEGLTNARKHAPGAAVTVSVRGGPGEGLTVEVRNPLSASPAARDVSGPGRSARRLRGGAAGAAAEDGTTDGDGAAAAPADVISTVPSALPALPASAAASAAASSTTSAFPAPASASSVTAAGAAASATGTGTTTAAATAATGSIPGAGQGLPGLAERARLAGGRLEHGREGDDFRLVAWLPWDA
ncbi:sensor histidine kinase [Streptomyces sp. YIM 98790]|uniref:sensor histidine kinase n=1 Tax=Streptomyces sp. YIM 98790 TaxID=2689077 RepID=UPI00140D5C25|nr:histidine kinase [Streptomyces sp. YIM 98790]